MDKTERIIMPAGLDLSGLTERGTNVDVAAPIVQVPVPPILAPSPAPQTMEDEVREELEQERIARDAAYVASQERTRLFKIQEKERLRLERIAADERLHAECNPPPVPFTPQDELRVRLEREANPKLYAEWAATFKKL
jgi:hypothetical protein